MTVNWKVFDILQSCSCSSVYCYALGPRSRERLLVKNVRLHSEKKIPLFCYNVPVLAVSFKLSRREFIANRFSFKITGVTSLTLTPIKPDTSLRRTVAGPAGVRLRDRES